MKAIRIFLLALLFLGSATASAVPRSCCAMDECQIVQCAEMGCLVANAGVFTAPETRLSFPRPSMPPAPAVIVQIPLIADDIWTPPD